MKLKTIGAAALLALLLGACSGDDEGAGSSGDGDGASGTAGIDGDGGTAGPELGKAVSPPTAPSDIQPVAADRSASGDGDVEVSGDRAAFVSPTGNIACVVTEESVICQVSDSTFDVQSGHLSVDSVGSCDAADADAITLTGSQGAWVCSPEDLLSWAAVDQGGWWAEEAGAATTSIGGESVAVLQYSSSLTVGGNTCTSTQDGVRCESDNLGKTFTLARTTYAYD